MSFTLLRRVLSPIADILTPSGEIIVLVKPQFEVGKDPLPNDGVVKKAAACEAMLRDIREFIKAETPWRVQQLKRALLPPPRVMPACAQSVCQTGVGVCEKMLKHW